MRGAWAAAAAMGVSVLAGPTAAEPYGFADLNQADVRSGAKFAVARIFKSQTAGRAEGGAIVVDARHGLLITAAHVVGEQGSTNWISFSDPAERYEAEVIKRVEPNAGYEDEGRDFAILKLADTTPVNGYVDVYLDELHEVDHQVGTYLRNDPAPTWDHEAPAERDKCTFTMRLPTVHSDSGSPVITNELLVAAVVMEGAESLGSPGYMIARVMPLSCVRDTIIEVVADESTEEIIEAFKNATDDQLKAQFQTRQPRYTNLQLARATSRLVASGERLDQERAIELTQLAVQRRLGHKYVYELALLSNESQHAAADQLFNLGLEARRQGSTTSAVAALSVATDLYADHARVLTGLAGTSGVDLRFSIAQSYKGAADATTMIAEITEQPDDLDRAYDFALAAVQNAPPGELSASSLAALGVAAQRSGRGLTAIPAYHFAINGGYAGNWVSQSLNDALANTDPGAAADAITNFDPSTMEFYAIGGLSN